MLRCTRSSALVFGLLVSAAVPALAQTGTPAGEAPPAPATGGATDAAPVSDPNAAPAGTPPAAAVTPPAPSASTGPLKLEGKNANIKLGLLLQPQYSAVSSPAAGVSGYNQNLYLRRARILVGGTLFGKIDYFLDTDFANLFLATPVAGAMGAANTALKATPGMNIQDVFATFHAIGDELKVDVGYMLPPMAHNSLQGAGTLYSWDYFGLTYQHTNAFGASAPPVGRDVGVQLRGLVLNGMLEYRAGMFQGIRVPATATEIASRNFFRLTGRVQVNLLDAETGYFYAGSYLGAKRILSFGLSGDFQDNYKYFAVDGFTDQPLGPGILTAQLNFAYWNGGTTVALAKQSALMGEAGYNLPVQDFKVGPIVRFEHLWGSGAVADQTRFALGAAFWPYGHTSNLKLFYSRINVTGDNGVNQVNLQWQVYFF
jgi:hypothetical protein